jgi:hypothetical protein
VIALAVSGGTVYAGGQFSSFGTETRIRLAAFDVGTGRPTPWRPDPNDVVQALAVSDGTLYVGGLFTTIAGQPRSRLAAFGTATGLITSWDPHADAGVKALAADGGTIYAAGEFTNVGGSPHRRVAALDAVTGRATDWDPGFVGGAVNALAVSDGRVFAAGSFTKIGEQFRNYVAAFDASTGQVTAWDPYADSLTVALAAAGGVVYAGGSFRSVGDALRQRIAALDVRSARPSPAPDERSRGDLAVRGDIVYAGETSPRSEERRALGSRRSTQPPAEPYRGILRPTAASPRRRRRRSDLCRAGQLPPPVGGSLTGNIAALRAPVNGPCEGAGETAGDGTAGAAWGALDPFPLEGGKRCSSSAGLSWTASSGAAQYDVFVDGHLECGDLAGTSCRPGNLTEGAHTWYVTARNACGSTTGPTWNFVQSGPPEEPIGPSPPDQGSVCPGQVLSWTGPALAEPIGKPQSRQSTGSVPRGEALESEGRGEDPDSARKAMDLYIKKREPEPSAGIPMKDYRPARAGEAHAAVLDGARTARRPGRVHALANAGP